MANFFSENIYHKHNIYTLSFIKGTKCDHNRCRKCCREKAAVEILDCPGIYIVIIYMSLSSNRE